MRIDLYNSAASQLTNDPASPQGVSESAAGSSSPSEDRITLSSGSTSIDSLVSAAMNTPAIRHDKVASLQQAISSGEYKLDPQAIAASILDEHA